MFFSRVVEWLASVVAAAELAVAEDPVCQVVAQMY